jgi:hypothetical protein
MENNRYSEMNLEEFGGISRSDFNLTAIIPRTKNKSAGFVRFSISRLKFMFFSLSKIHISFFDIFIYI